MCGENFLRKESKLVSKGSPPRVRGKRGHKAFVQVIPRITPACAGKTVYRVDIHTCKRDHPRVCGENEDNYKGFNYRLGSPPRVRGKLKLLLLLKRFRRITPACAGKTEAVRKAEPSIQDHPRVCGENVSFILAYCFGTGSPPRVRGKLLL